MAKKSVKLYTDNVLEKFYSHLVNGNLQNLHIPHSDVFYVRTAVEAHYGKPFTLEHVEWAMRKEGWTDQTMTVEYRGETFSGYNKPKRTPKHPTKSHVVLAKEGTTIKMIRFGEQGASTAGKPKAGESDKMKKKRASFKARHGKNIKRGKLSAAYWADKVKWQQEYNMAEENVTLNKVLNKLKNVAGFKDLSPNQMKTRLASLKQVAVKTGEGKGADPLNLFGPKRKKVDKAAVEAAVKEANEFKKETKDIPLDAVKKSLRPKSRPSKLAPKESVRPKARNLNMGGMAKAKPRTGSTDYRMGGMFMKNGNK